MQLGVTWKQLVALGYTIQPGDRARIKDLPRFEWTDATVWQGSVVVVVVFHRGTVTRIGAIDQAWVVTDSGLRAQAAEQEVRRLYGRRAIVFDAVSFTGQPSGHHSYVIKSSDGRLALVVTIENGAVASLHVGPKEEFWIEPDGTLWIPDPTDLRELDDGQGHFVGNFTTLP